MVEFVFLLLAGLSYSHVAGTLEIQNGSESGTAACLEHKHLFHEAQLV